MGFRSSWPSWLHFWLFRRNLSPPRHPPHQNVLSASGLRGMREGGLVVAFWPRGAVRIWPLRPLLSCHRGGTTVCLCVGLSLCPSSKPRHGLRYVFLRVLCRKRSCRVLRLRRRPGIPSPPMNDAIAIWTRFDMEPLRPRCRFLKAKKTALKQPNER